MPPPPTSASIGASLLLTSELRGNIEAPDWCFETTDTTARSALDALMLTQGWRRYDVSAALRDETAELRYPLEAGQELSGTIRKNGLWNRSKRLDQYGMQLLVPQFRFSRQVPIDTDGSFTINGFDFPDSTLFVLRSVAVKGLLPGATVRVVPDSFPTVRVLPRHVLQAEREPYTAHAFNYIEHKRALDMRNILIDSVVVAGRKPIEPELPQHRFARYTWTAEKIKEMGAYTILDFVMRMPGVTVKGAEVLYHGARPAFMLDGVIDNSANTGEYSIAASPQVMKIIRNASLSMEFSLVPSTTTQEPPMPVWINWPTLWVSRVDLIIGGNTLYWGSEALDGIISITTKQGAELDAATALAEASDVAISSPLGYQIPAEFYSPAYPTEQSRASKVPDYRTTLYWNPAVSLDGKGCVQVGFYTSDAPANYNVVVEGVTEQGKIIRSEKAL